MTTPFLSVPGVCRTGLFYAGTVFRILVVRPAIITGWRTASGHSHRV